MAEPQITNRQTAPNQQAKVVAKANVEASNKKGFAKVLDAFIKSDPKTVMNDVYTKVIVPGVQRVILQSVNAGLSEFFGMELPQGVINSITAPSGMPHIGYSNISTAAAQATQTMAPVAGYTGLSVYQRLTWDFKHDADSVLQSMADYLSEYHTVSVGKLCEFAGIKNVSTDYNFGWDDLRSARVVELVNGKWALSLPNTIALK